MPAKDQALMDRILTYDFPDQMATATPLERFRLWPRREAFEDKVIKDLAIFSASGPILIEEYLRFVYLKALSGETLTPSASIDAVWHLHMTATDDYDSFCRDLVRHRITHTPNLSPYVSRDGYDRTVALYLDQFGELPRRDVWPDPDEWAAYDKRTKWAAIACGAIAVTGAAIMTYANPDRDFFVSCIVVFLALYIPCHAWKRPSSKIVSGEANCG